MQATFSALDRAARHEEKAKPALIPLKYLRAHICALTLQDQRLTGHPQSGTLVHPAEETTRGNLLLGERRSDRGKGVLGMGKKCWGSMVEHEEIHW